MEVSRLELTGRLSLLLSRVYEYCYHANLEPSQVISKLAEMFEIPRSGICLNIVKCPSCGHFELASAIMHLISMVQDPKYIPNERIESALRYLEKVCNEFPMIVYSLSKDNPSLAEQRITRQMELNNLFA